jgi:uncharacterized protein (DUF608 family)
MASKPSCPSSKCSCNESKDLNRREFFGKTAAGAAIAYGFRSPNTMAGPFSLSDFESLIPVDKKLSESWIKALYETGEPEVFSGDALQFIGMPIGGIGCGQLYLGGDGRLWLWDIFRTQYNRAKDSQSLTTKEQGGHYVDPPTPDNAVTSRNGAHVDQGFVLKVKQDGKTQTRFLDERGFKGREISFRGEYPVGRVNYLDKTLPVSACLEAFSPFIPLRAEDSAIPATILSWELRNQSDRPVEIELVGYLENAVSPYDRDKSLGLRQTKVLSDTGKIMVLHQAAPLQSPSDTPYQLEESHGHGSMALALLDQTERAWANPGIGTANEISAEGFFETSAQQEALSEFDQRPVAAVGTKIMLAPNESRTLRFILGWFFSDFNQQEFGSMLKIKDFKTLKRQYARHFNSADEVINTIADRWESLGETTRLWNRTWYDSTLPYWLLDRSMIGMNCLASQTSHWFSNGRFWGWEGVDCCPGTCTHVWQYAQGFARLFPEIERHLRRDVDLGISFNPDNGIIAYRSEQKSPAVDGQAGTILRVLREHRLTGDLSFLKGVWPRVKLAFGYLETLDTNGDSLLDANQPHTLDAAWSGEIAWISSLYLAAAQACVEMAEVMNDEAFAKHCARILRQGRKQLVAQLYNGEYFIHKPDPGKPQMINTNTGCHIDQVFGQSFAWQVGLRERIVPRKETVNALNHLWKYNFTPDAGGYALKHRAIGETFRWYAMEGEAGLLMTTWPRGGGDKAIPGKGPRGKDNGTEYSGAGGYFNECMNGFEYQAASHMIYEGGAGSKLVEQGLAIFKAVHDRYSATKRNPYNEIECSDHYARSMAAYGVFLAACGFDYDGPRGHICFAPRINPDNFKAPFTAADGWGTFEQKRTPSKMEAVLGIKFGQLKIKSLSLAPAADFKTSRVLIDGKKSVFKVSEQGITIRLSEEVILKTNHSLRIEIQN